jgi:hypothetical protein
VHTVAYDGSISFVRFDQFPSKLASTLIPCSPEVAEACKRWSRDVTELPPVGVKFPAPQRGKDKTDSV